MSAGVLGDNLGKVFRTGRHRSHGCGAVASIRVQFDEDASARAVIDTAIPREEREAAYRRRLVEYDAAVSEPVGI